MKKYISIYFEISLIDKIKKLSKEEGRSFNNMVIELIRRGLNEKQSLLHK